MSNVIEPRRFMALVSDDVLDGLLTVGDAPDVGLVLEDYYSCILNQDYYIAELVDTAGTTERNVSVVYLLTGAIALHEEYTNGVFIDKEDIDKVNDVFGYDGGGAALLYSMLSGPERLDLIKTYMEKMHPFLGPGEIFARTLTIEEMSKTGFGSHSPEEKWEDLDDFYDAFSDDTIEIRSVDGMKLAMFGTCIDDIANTMAMTDMQCYIFDLCAELEKVAGDKSADMLDMGRQIRLDLETGEIVDDTPLLPAPRSIDDLFVKYQNGHLSKQEYEAKVLIALNEAQWTKDKEDEKNNLSNASNNHSHDLKDRDASEIKKELREAWQGFGSEDYYYGRN